MGSKSTIRFGLIGCGRVARFHADALTQLPGVELKAVCDMDPERVQTFASHYGIDPYTDYRALVRRPDIGVVCIATPSGDDPRIGMDAA